MTTIGQGLWSIAPSIHGEWKTSALRERAIADGRWVSTISIVGRGGVAKRREQAARVASDAVRVGHGPAVERDLHVLVLAFTSLPRAAIAPTLIALPTSG